MQHKFFMFCNELVHVPQTSCICYGVYIAHGCDLSSWTSVPPTSYISPGVPQNGIQSTTRMIHHCPDTLYHPLQTPPPSSPIPKSHQSEMGLPGTSHTIAFRGIGPSIPSCHHIHSSAMVGNSVSILIFMSYATCIDSSSYNSQLMHCSRRILIGLPSNQLFLIK